MGSADVALLHQEMEGFEQACRTGDDSGAIAYLANGLPYDRPLCHVYSPFHLACLYGRTAVVDWMIQAHLARLWHLSRLWKEFKHPLVSLGTEEGETPLHLACQSESAALVELLIEHGADIECVDDRGLSPLYHACLVGHWDSVYFLIKRAAAKHIVGIQALACLRAAIQSGKVAVLRLLLDHGLSPNSAPAGLCSPLHSAAREGALAMVELLLARGARINHQDARGATPLHDAVRFRHEDVVERLLDTGANLSLTDYQGRTARQIARERGDEAMRRLLRFPRLRTRLLPAPDRRVLWDFAKVFRDHDTDFRPESLRWLKRRFQATMVNEEASELDVQCQLENSDADLALRAATQHSPLRIYFQDTVSAALLYLDVQDEGRLAECMEEAVFWRHFLHRLDLRLPGVRGEYSSAAMGQGMPLRWSLMRYLDHSKSMVLESMIIDSHSAAPRHIRNYLTQVLSEHGICLPIGSRGESYDRETQYGHWAFGPGEDTLLKFLDRLKFRLVRRLLLTMNHLLPNDLKLQAALTNVFIDHLADQRIDGDLREELMELTLSDLAELESAWSTSTATYDYLQEMVHDRVFWDRVERWCNAESGRERDALASRPGIVEAGNALRDWRAARADLAMVRQRLHAKRKGLLMHTLMRQGWILRGDEGMHITLDGVLALGEWMGWWTYRKNL